MKSRIFSSLLFILSMVFFNVSASPEDTIKKEIKIPTLIKYIDGNAFSSPQLTFHSLDTTLNAIEINNPASRNHCNYLSNAGSAVSSQVYQPSGTTLTDVGFHTYDLYLFSGEKIRYFKTNKAFSEINYHMASGKEAQITVALSENITKNWNIGLDFNRLGTLGFLKNGITFHSNVDFYTWLHSGNNRYNLLAYALWNVMENQVNGGLHSDSLFDNSSVSNLAQEGMLVNLTDAKNHFRNREFFLNQFYDVGDRIEEITNDTVKSYHFKPTGRIEHSIRFESRAFTYLDNNSGDYYRNSFFSASTLDSLHFYDLRNRIAWSSMLNAGKSTDSLHAIYYSVAAEHQWLRYSQSSKPEIQFNDTMLENASVAGTLNSMDDESRLYWKAAGTYVFAGANKTDYEGKVSLHSPLSHFGNINLTAHIVRKSPELIYQRYLSNHFIWENNFGKSSEKNISAEYNFSKYNFSLGAEVTSVSNFIHLDSMALPVEEAGEIQVMKFTLDKNFHLGKFHFNNSFIVQKVNREDALHLPSLISTQSLFYESFFFKSALLMQIGVDFHFNTSYYADAFMPATGLFYWQKEKKTGGYSLADFFINFRIKTARLFLKFENVTNNFTKRGYYLTPHYPMQGMTLTFGVSWRFFDQ